MHDVTADMLERLFADAGMRSGMRVLDVGCGHGKVAALAARHVGEDGEVVAFDREPSVLDVARRTQPDGIRFVEADIDSFEWNDRFDGAVGRRVLMYQHDPVEAVRRIARHVRPGGFLAFQEIDVSFPPTGSAPLPLHTQVRDWIWASLPKETPRDFGFRLYDVFSRAGLTPDVRAEALVHTPSTAHPLGEIVRWMLPKILAAGAATEAEIDLDTLDARLLAERSASNATYVDQLVFGVHARV